MSLEDDLAQRKEKLSPARRALLEKWKQGRLSGIGESIGIPRRSSDHAVPLSFAQQRLWLLDHLMPQQPTYIIPIALRLYGALDLAALAQSIEMIVQRHEVLRTTFVLHDEQPVQCIAPFCPVPLPVRDLHALSSESQEAEVLRIVAVETRQPFDLVRGPLLRATLLRLGSRQHVLLVTFHHIVSDGWSTRIFFRELDALYRAARRNIPAALPELPIQYADFAIWQRDWLQGEVLEAQLAYWRQQLATASAMLALPTDYPRPSVLTSSGARQHRILPIDLVKALQELSQREGTTLFMAALAGFAILLGRYSGQYDIVVGVPIANRRRSELEHLIGFFVNTLVLRVDLTGEPTFRQLLQRVREVCLGAYAHQDLPFERLVEVLQPERSLSHTPIFQVMFMIQEEDSAPFTLDDLRIEPLEIESGIAKFDLVLEMRREDQEWVAQCQYNSDLFAAATIERMAAQFQTLLAAIVADPQQRIDRLALLPDTELQQIYSWATTLVLEDACLHWLIEDQAARTPGSIAVEHDGATITYADLDRQANQLAHHLRSLGVGPDTRVGVCLPRSIPLVVTLLGVLKAGGCYVPLDPDYPQERLEFMLADSAARVLVTQESLRDALLDYDGAIVCVDRDAPRLNQQPTVAPCTDVQPDHLMLILYTSGSTGLPKGVLLTHRNMVSYVVAARNRCPLRPTDRLLQFASISFDTSAEDLYTTLTIGATVVLCTGAMLTSPEGFAAACARERITVLSLPTAFWHVLAEASASGEFTLPPSVRHMIIGGEHAALDRVRQWQALYGERVTLLNLYGPTETTIAATGYLVPTILPANLPDTPIGRSLANMRAYVLDAQLELVPIGVPGELYIGGMQVARGYGNRPDLTAERFIPDPFNQTFGSRLYKTGDRVRAMPDGTLIFLGRIDHQVKLRGFRIELGEIEVVLRQYSGVRDAVVIARERPEASSDKRLVAYVVADQMLSFHALRDHLKARLPEYMVPSAFVQLDALPLMPNGKVNSQALPIPDLGSYQEQESFVMPRDSLEAQLVTIWERLLGVCPIGVRDNFFALGGHSLLAVQLFSQIRKETGQELPLAVLLEEATVEHLAQALRQQRSMSAVSPIVEIRPGGSRTPLFCLHPVGGQVFSYYTLTRYLGADQPVYGIQSVDPRDAPEQSASVAAIAASYIEALRVIQPEGPYLLLGWSFGGIVAFEMARQLEASACEVGLLALLDTFLPIVTHNSDEIDEIDMLLSFSQDLSQLFDNKLKVSRSDLEWLDLDERLARILELAEEANVVPLGIDLSYVASLFRIFKANRLALLRYTPSTYTGHIHVFQASERSTTSERDITREWAQFAIAGATRHVLPGNHYTILQEPNVRHVAEELNACLEGVQPIKAKD